MALSERNGRPYYRKSVRRNGRVTSEYCGAGAVAILMDQQAQVERSRKEAAAADWRAERARLEAEERQHMELFRLVETITRAALEAAGFHRHDRGGWRRQRMSQDVARAEGGPFFHDPEDALAKLKAINDGDAGALAWLRAVLAGDTTGELVERLGGDTARVAEGKILDRLAGKVGLGREATARKMEMLRAELAGPNPTPLERVLAERASLCWLALNWYEANHANSTDLTLGQADFHQRRIDRAHRRFLSACVALAKVRKLALPGPTVLLSLKQAVTVETPAPRPARRHIHQGGER